MSTKRRVQIIASDAGGTMTDMMIVDTDGNFTIGKAATTPEDQSLGFWESIGRWPGTLGDRLQPRSRQDAARR